MEEKQLEKKKIDKRGKYQGLSLHMSLVNEIKKHIDSHPEYKGVADFVRESVREKIKIESTSGGIWGPTAISIKDWARRSRVLEIKINSIEDKMEAMENILDEKLSGILAAIETKKD